VTPKDISSQSDRMTDTASAAGASARPWSEALLRPRALQALLALPAVLLVGGFVIVPTFYALIDSFQNQGHWTLANYATFATRPPYPQVLGNTLAISLIVTALTMLISAPLAAFLSVKTGRGAALVLMLVSASLWISVLVKIYAWQVVLAREGPLNLVLLGARVTSEPIPFLYTRMPVVLSMTQFLVPYAMMMMYAGMKRVDWDLITAARSLGARLGMVFTQIYWPQIRFSVVTSGLVVFMIATSFYVAPALLLVNRYESGMAATTGVVLTVLLLAVSWVSLRAAGVSFARAAGELSK
jgi:putative spermidine/putrescine transport system permease protein